MLIFSDKDDDITTSTRHDNHCLSEKVNHVKKLGTRHSGKIEGN